MLPSHPLSAANGKLEVTFIDVGQADAIFASCPDGKHHLLIDSGDNRYPSSAKNFRTFLTNAFAGQPRMLDVVVASHVHADHIGSMEWVLKNFQVGTYVDNGDEGDTTTFGNLLKERRKQTKAGKLVYINGRQNHFSEVDFCPAVKLEIFLPWAVDADLSDPNDRSVAVRLEHIPNSSRTNSFLFVGDIEDHAEKVMLNQFTEAQQDKLDADVLKVGHHGSDTSSAMAFIMAISPRVAIVSVGKKGVSTNAQYKHPRLSTIRNYETWFKQSAPPIVAPAGKFLAYDKPTKAWKQQTRPPGMWLTMKDGSIIVSSDGNGLQVDTKPSPN